MTIYDVFYLLVMVSNVSSFVCLVQVVVNRGMPCSSTVTAYALMVVKAVATVYKSLHLSNVFPLPNKHKLTGALFSSSFSAVLSYTD